MKDKVNKGQLMQELASLKQEVEALKDFQQALEKLRQIENLTEAQLQDYMQKAYRDIVTMGGSFYLPVATTVSGTANASGKFTRQC